MYTLVFCLAASRSLLFVTISFRIILFFSLMERRTHVSLEGTLRTVGPSRHLIVSGYARRAQPASA